MGDFFVKAKALGTGKVYVKSHKTGRDFLIHLVLSGSGTQKTVVSLISGSYDWLQAGGRKLWGRGMA